MPRARLRAAAAQFARDDRGAATILMLYGLGILLMVGGVMLDFANRHRVESVLQSAADVAAASAAIRLSEPLSLESPEDQARRVVAFSLGGTELSDAWTAGSFDLGRFDPDSKSFVAGEEGANAVRVTLSRSPLTRNGEPTFLLGMLGIDSWDIRVQAVARVQTVDTLPCEDPLLSLKLGTQLGSGRLFAGVCVYARAELDYGGMPGWLTADTGDFVSGLIVGGLTEALPIHQIGLLDTVRPSRSSTAGLRRLVSGAVALPGEMLFDTAQLSAGGTYHVSCPPDGVLILDGPLQLTDVALLSDCPIRFGTEVSARAALIVSNLLGVLPDPSSIAVPTDAVLRRTTDCAPGEGAKIFVFVDASVKAAIPALVSPSSPLSPLLEDTVGLVSTVVNRTVNLLGGLLNVVDEVASQTIDLTGLAGVCIGMDTMLSSDRVSLH